MRTAAQCTNKEIGLLLPDYIDGELSAEEAAAFEAHIDACAACLADLANDASIAEAFRRIREKDASD